MGEWIEHNGMGCPVARNVRVDVRFADGAVRCGQSAGWWDFGCPIAPRVSNWRHERPGHPSPPEIIAWRLHDDGQAEADHANARQDIFRRIGNGETFPAIDDPNPIREPITPARKPEKAVR